MEVIIEEGRSVEEATEIALEKLNVARDQVTIEVINEGKEGFFGKKARVRVTYDPDPDGSREIDITQLTEQIIEMMGMECRVEMGEMDGKTKVDINTPDGSLLIGKGGETLEAFQHILNRMINRNKDVDERRLVLFDVEGYRERHRDNMTKMAYRMADRAKETHYPQMTDPLNSYDRRVVHLALKDDASVTTFSRGDGVLKYVVVEPVRKRRDQGGHGGGGRSNRPRYEQDYRDADNGRDDSERYRDRYSNSDDRYDSGDRYNSGDSDRPARWRDVGRDEPAPRQGYGRREPDRYGGSDSQDHPRRDGNRHWDDNRSEPRHGRDNDRDYDRYNRDSE